MVPMVRGQIAFDGFGWYGGVPNGKREMLVLNQNGAMRYAYENGFGSETPGSTAADVYLIGRVQGENGSITYDTTKRTLTVKTTADDLKWFPEYGGLIAGAPAGKRLPTPYKYTSQQTAFYL